MILNYFSYIGFLRKKEEPNYSAYNSTRKLDLAIIYKTYLIDLKQSQDSRLNTIENKNSQLIGQSSIVISIVALFIPLFITNLSALDLWAKIILVTVFFLLVIHFVITILHASKTLEIDKSKYMTGSTSTVTKESRSISELNFVNNENKDLVRIINHNNRIINRTASNLVYATRCFKIAIIGFLIFSLLLLSALLLTKKNPESISISNIKELKSVISETEKNQLTKSNQALQNDLMFASKKVDSLLKIIKTTNRSIDSTRKLSN